MGYIYCFSFQPKSFQSWAISSRNSLYHICVYTYIIRQDMLYKIIFFFRLHCKLCISRSGSISITDPFPHFLSHALWGYGPVTFDGHTYIMSSTAVSYPITLSDSTTSTTDSKSMEQFLKIEVASKAPHRIQNNQKTWIGNSLMQLHSWKNNVFRGLKK